MKIVIKQIKLIVEAINIIIPPILAFHKQKKQPVNDIINVTRLIIGNIKKIV